MAYNKRGNTYYKLGNYQQAIKEYTKAIELNKNDSDSYIWRGIAYARLGADNNAINDLNKAYELDPDDQSLHYYNISCMYSVQNKPDKACDYLKKSIEKGYKDWDWIKKDKDFDSIRNSSCYQEIMAGK